MILPSIDLMDGKAVQLVGGAPAKKKVVVDDVFALARKFSRYGKFQVIDLDAAFGNGKDNRLIVKELCRNYDVRVGGGIRSVDEAVELVRCGAKEVIIGTRANKEFLSLLCDAIGRKRVVVALDARGGEVMARGWTKGTGKDVFVAIKEFSGYCSEFLYTCIDKEGRMKGGDIETVRKITLVTSNKICASGGISTADEIRMFDDAGANVVLGMALYTGKLSLDEVFASRVDFDKGNGIVPVVVQEAVSRDVMMVGYMDKVALSLTLKSGRMTYYSRSRKKMWVKGEESGNWQELVAIKLDCDGDTVLATIRQTGVACHTGSYSCFGDENRSESNILSGVYNVILDRIENPREGSYTSKIAKDKELISRKINEEAYEVILAANDGKREEIVWEIADLVYFLLVLAAASGIDPREIWNMLDSRRSG
ncbi:MAG: bifunctional phosphoribosyl-AMP cyclohydrolase/phosphoribosyl-ATP diphosphatase HisIE [Syntrophobacterales bacterium]|nr:MAG: bifunctional phosphoribosyl-AMP cyclohydrolase/phosphoribosyl-ATP diphosphatase HisIE [Syntrophobacterales bacterium]